ncbi:lipid asymmetry maintenance protein MlaB [Rhodoferax sp.]|uniref:STAS domain-containing protein n=1 Tax=Rhodoferax sp. TaxID=50421 RepID=UPI0027708D7C|nr:STAS domain-containing protein [Rhodoferax sp.]
MLVLPAELTHAGANACLRMLVQGLQAHANTEIWVDAGALRRFDSSALAVLLEFRRECQASGKQVSIRDLPTRLSDLAALYGIAELLSTPG